MPYLKYLVCPKSGNDRFSLYAIEFLPVESKKGLSLSIKIQHWMFIYPHDDKNYK
jgi:hypothetical protein